MLFVHISLLVSIHIKLPIFPYCRCVTKSKKEECRNPYYLLFIDFTLNMVIMQTYFGVSPSYIPRIAK